MPGVLLPAGFRIEVLSEEHDRGAFLSGSPQLDEYLWHRAGQDIRKRVSACFVLTNSQRIIAGYYTLSATSIVLADLPERLARKLPRYHSIPATLMGRLAVDLRFRGQGYCELLLVDAFRRSLQSEIASYAIVVDAKDETAERFYDRYGFRRLQQGGGRLFLPLMEIAKLFV